MKKLLYLSIFLASCVHAVPTISNVSGTFEQGQSVTITCTGAGSKSPAAPIIWAPFDTSQNPSSFGTQTSWNQIQNLGWTNSSGYGSSGGMDGTDGNGVWTMRVDASGFGWNDLSQKWCVIRRTKQNYIVPYGSSTNNQKNFRVWPAGGSGYPNLYWSIHNGRCFVENIGGTTDSGFWSSGLNPQSTSWLFEEIISQASSANGVKDGSVLYRINGVQKANGSIISRSNTAPASWVSMYPLHIVVANKGSWTNPAWSNSNDAWFDDCYVDKTWQRVYIGDASTYANCRKFGMIIPSAWSNTSITGRVEFHSIDFPAESTAYVYIFDSSNAPNAVGFPVTIGGSAPSNPPPVPTAVNPSTGSPQGTTVSTVTGTGFQSGMTIMVGTNAATNVTVVFSTVTRFTIPRNAPGTTGLDLLLTNTDQQTGTIISTMSYTAAASNQPPYDVSAGDDWVTTLPSGVSLSGSASDDGLPAPPGALTYLWQVEPGGTGIGTVTFGSDTSLQTTATFVSSGTYYVSLSASDSAFTVKSSTVAIEVLQSISVKLPRKKKS